MLGRCYLCNKEFELNKEQEKDFIENLNYQYFCSKECKIKHKNIMNQFISQVQEEDENNLDHKCYYCGKKFILSSGQKYKIKQNPDHKCYCSKECQNEASKKKIIYNCDYCNKEFILSKTQRFELNKDVNTKHFCSKECFDKSKCSRINKIYIKNDGKYKYNCNYCGKEFILSRNQQFLISKNPSHKCFCSKECQDNSHRLLIYYNCSQCNKKFILNKDQRYALNKNLNYRCFCSPSCRSKYTRSHIINNI